ncbi:MAG TPA: pectin acetylesterase-family hydrolase, partial [Byssovorax sp.]
TTTTTTSTGGSGGTGGTGGFVEIGGFGGFGGATDASPINVVDDTWTYVPIAGSTCMNGTPTGIGINKISTSDDVVIYLEGGNACFNTLSCFATYHPNGYGQTDFDHDLASPDSELNFPIFTRPTGGGTGGGGGSGGGGTGGGGPAAGQLFKDYNFVYVPYCTGDVHAGDLDTTVAGVYRHFHGAENMDRYLARIVATFPGARNVIVTGSSAGGFGAAFNYDRVSNAFGPNVNVTLLDDSGPPMSSDFVAPCLQKHFIETWGLDHTLPADCTDCRPDSGVFMEPLVRFLVTKYGGQRLGLISSTQDKTISGFWSFGDDNCANIEVMGGYDGTMYTDGLTDLRNNIVGSGNNFRMFLIDGTGSLPNGTTNSSHVWLNWDPYTVNSNGTNLGAWLQEFLDPQATWPNVPPSGS